MLADSDADWWRFMNVGGGGVLMDVAGSWRKMIIVVLSM